MTQLYTSDNASTGFDATTAGNTPTNWTGVGGSALASTTGAISGHTHTLLVPGNAIYNGISAAADMEVVFAQKAISNFSTSAATGHVGALIRADTAVNNGYFLAVEPTGSGLQATIYKNVSGSFAAVISANLSFGINSGDVFLERFQIIGTAIKGKVWKATSTEPTTWSVTATDGSISAAGYGGVFNYFTGTNGISDFGLDSVNSTTGLINLSQAVSASGGNITISGTYTGTAPSAINANVDGGSYSAISSPTISGGNWSGTIPTPTTGFHTIGVQNNGATATTDNGIYNVAVLNTLIAPNNAAILYSPGNWNVSSSVAITENGGAYFKMGFTGTLCLLDFDVSTAAPVPTQIWWRIDESQWAKANIASQITLTVPPDTASSTNVTYHIVEVVVKTITQAYQRWNPAATGGAVKLTNIEITGSGSVTAPLALTPQVLAYGDSLFEGIYTLNDSAVVDTDGTDAMQSVSYILRGLLGCEFGNIGFGGTGLTSTAGGVPVWISSYNLIYQGVSRTFPSSLSAIIVEVSINDQGSSLSPYTTAATNFLTALLGATFSNTKIIVLSALQSIAPSFLNTGMQAAIAAVASSRVSYLDTTGFFNTTYGADSGNGHPSGANNQLKISPQIAELIRPILYPSGGGGGGGFVIGG